VAIEVKYLPRSRGVKGWLASIAIFPVAAAGMVYDLAKLWWEQRKRLSVLVLAGAMVAGAAPAEAHVSAPAGRATSPATSSLSRATSPPVAI
jgi:hypothetical protein